MTQKLHFQGSFLQKYLYMCMKIFTGTLSALAKNQTKQEKPK